MSNQTTNRNYKRGQGVSRYFKMEEAIHAYEGSIISINAAGYAVRGSDTSGELFVGVCRDEADNSAGADGAINVLVWANGVFDFAFSGTAAQADIGKKVYIVDDQTVGLAATTSNDVLVGKIVDVISASLVRVAITPDL